MNTILEETPGLEGMGATSARGALWKRNTATIVVALMAGVPGMQSTSSREKHFFSDAVLMGTQATSSGATMLPRLPVEEVEQQEVTRRGLSELRRVSGLTWGQLARLFSVSRRSVHFWASGKPMSSEHEEHLHRLLAMLRGLDSSADVIRGVLLSFVAGDQVLDTLAGRRYSEAEDALRAVNGSGVVHPSKERTPLSVSASEARHPLPVDVLAAGEVRASHSIEGRGRAVRTARSKDRGQS